MGDHLAVSPARRRLLLVAGLAALGLLTLTFGRMLLVRYELGQRAETVRQEIAVLQTENAQLKDELADARSDAAVEQMAREQLGWAKPGETAVILVGPESQSPRPAAPARAPDSTPNWRRWWEYLLGGPT